MFRQFAGLDRNDRAEGKIPEGFWDAFERDNIIAGTPLAELAETRRRAEESLNRLRAFTYVSCWTMSPTENALLWEVYAPHGIAVRTRVGKLRRAQLISSDVSIRNMGMQYADDWSGLEALGFEHYGIVPNKLFLHTKRTLFAGENEVRFYVSPPAKYERDTVGNLIPSVRGAPPWHAVEFDSLGWIEEVVADSSLPLWALETLQPVVRQHRLKLRQSGR